MAKQPNSANKVVASSGNVFADLGLSDAAELDTKAWTKVMVPQLRELGQCRLRDFIKSRCLRGSGGRALVCLGYSSA